MERARGEQYYCGALNVTPKNRTMGLFFFLPPLQRHCDFLIKT
jgi:hypothetical protein